MRSDEQDSIVGRRALGRKVWELRQRFGLTQDRLSKDTNIEIQQYATFERDVEPLKGRPDRRFQPHHISKIIKYLKEKSSGLATLTRADEFELMYIVIHGEAPVWEDVDDTIFVNREEFKLGGHHKEAVVFDFAPRGYASHLINSSFDDTPLKLFDDCRRAEVFDAITKEENVVIERSSRLFNGSHATLTRIHSTRAVGADEEPQLTLQFKRSDYIRRRSTRRLVSTVLTEDERQELTSSIFDGVKEEYCGGFGAVIAIVTSDEKLLFFQRSANTAGDFHAYDCTVTEASNSTTDIDDFRHPSPLRTALRGLAEEAALSSIENMIQNHVRFHGVICRTRFYEWSLYGSLNLSKARVSSRDLVQAKSENMKAKLEHNTGVLGTTFTLAQDAFEFQRYAAVNFNLRDVARFICTQHTTDYGFINAVLTLKSLLNVNASAIAHELSQYEPL